MGNNNTPRELHGSRLLGYAIGQFGLILTNMFVGVFIFQFYVYTINLDSILTSIGISIQLIISAFSSIFFGIAADNKKPGRFGKRRPYMLYGLPLWIFTSIIIWFPPKCPETNQLYLPTAIFLWGILILKTISGSSILTVHLSMLTEQSQLFGLIAIIITFFSIDESFHKFSKPIIKKVSFKRIFPQMTEPLKDKKYRKFLSVRLFNAMAGRILGVIVIPFLTYTLVFRGNSFYIYVIVSVTSKFIGFVIWRRILKKHAVIKTYTICILASAISSLLDLFFLINLLPNIFKIILFILTIGTVLGSMYGFGLFNPPLASALVYEAAENNKEFSLDEAVSNISGAYFGLSSFVLAFGQSIASLLLGFILTGPNAENSTIITLTLSSMGIFYLISFYFLRKLKLNK